MAKSGESLIAGPDFLTADFFDVVISQGDWISTAPANNLRDEDLSLIAQSNTAAETDTIVEVDFGVDRDVRAVIVPDANVTRTGVAKVDMTNTAKWDGVTIVSAVAAGASALTLAASINATVLAVGDVFSIGGDTGSPMELIVGGALASAGDSTTLNTGENAAFICQPIYQASGGVASAYAASTAVKCHSGDYSSANAVLLGDFEDWWPEEIALGTGDWGTAGLWDGKRTDEDAESYPRPYIKIYDQSHIAQFLKLSIRDTANTAGNVQLPRLFVAGGWVGEVYIAYGASLGGVTNTIKRRGKFGARFFSVGNTERRVGFTVPNADFDDAMNHPFDMINQISDHKQVFISLDLNDVLNRNRLSFLGYFTRLPELNLSNHDAADVFMEITEVSSGNGNT